MDVFQNTELNTESEWIYSFAANNNFESIMCL